MKRHVVGIGDLVGGHEPGAQDRIPIAGLARAAVFRAAYGHIEAERVPSDHVESIRLFDAAALLTDDDDEFELVIVAAVREPDGNRAACANQGGVGFQKDTSLPDLGGAFDVPDAGVGLDEAVDGLLDLEEQAGMRRRMANLSPATGAEEIAAALDAWSREASG